MLHAVQECGATLPPWRDTAALLSKWRPRRSIDMDWSAAARKGTVPEGLEQPIMPPHPRQSNDVVLLGHKPSPKPSPSPTHGARAASEVAPRRPAQRRPRPPLQPPPQRTCCMARRARGGRRSCRRRCRRSPLTSRAPPSLRMSPSTAASTGRSAALPSVAPVAAASNLLSLTRSRLLTARTAAHRLQPPPPPAPVRSRAAV